MATALKLRTDIKKLKDALKVKKIPANIKSKLESQLKKSQDELAALKKGKKTPTGRSAVKGTQTALSRLKSLIKKPKYGVYADGQTKDLEEDAVQGAFPKGRRVSKGLKSNQFGSAKENKGKVYYEYRSNRLDVKQPKKRQTYPKLEKGGYMADGGSVKKKIADGGMMAKGGAVGDIYTKMYRDTYQEKQFNKKIDKKRELDNYATKNKITIDNNNIISVDGEKIGYINKINQKTGQEKTNWDFVKFASGGMMAKGGKLSLSEFAERYDDNEDNNMHSENVVLLAENFGTKQDILDAKTILAKHEAIGSLPYYLMQERDALSNRLYAKYQEAAKKKESDGGMMADGGEIKKGDMVKVDNPYWHAAMGTDKPVVRKVTMVAGEDVFFKDGSTSSMKYITKMEAGGVMAEA